MWRNRREDVPVTAIAALKTGIWAVMADETTDLSNREQMAIVVRYVDDSDGLLVIREDPIGLLDVLQTLRQTRPASESELKMSGANLAEVLIRKLQKVGLDTTGLVGQCYDSAASMSSEKVGVAAKVKAKAPLADYYHCSAYTLNLSTSLMTKVPVVRNCLDTLEAVICFLSDGAKRGDLLRWAQSQDVEDEKRHKLVKLCQTRFIERHVAVERFCEQLPAVWHALQLIATWSDSRASSKAAMLYTAVSRTEFLVGLVIAGHLAGIMRPLAVSLQEKGSDLTKALGLVDAVQAVLERRRSGSEKEFSPLMAKVVAFAVELDVEVTKPRLVKRSTHRDNAGHKVMTTEDHYRINVFNPALDYVIQDIGLRFGKPTKLAAGLSKILPKRVATSDPEWRHIQPAFERYRDLLKDVTESQMQSELDVWTAMWRNQREDVPVTAIAALNACPASIFPVVHALLRVLAVLPVSTAEAERVFF